MKARRVFFVCADRRASLQSVNECRAKPMKSKCPYCGKVIELQPEYFERRWTCDNCGHEYIVGVVYIASKAFSNGVTKILCPHCGQRNVLPLAAANNDVDCGSCGRTFHVHITQSSSQDPKTLSTGNKAKKKERSGGDGLLRQRYCQSPQE